MFWLVLENKRAGRVLYLISESQTKKPIFKIQSDKQVKIWFPINLNHLGKPKLPADNVRESVRKAMFAHNLACASGGTEAPLPTLNI